MKVENNGKTFVSKEQKKWRGIYRQVKADEFQNGYYNGNITVIFQSVRILPSKNHHPKFYENIKYALETMKTTSREY